MNAANCCLRPVVADTCAVISYILPTRDRPERLKATLQALASLGDHSECGGAEVVVVDVGSRERLILARALESGLPIKYLLRERHEGALARNIAGAASDPAADWLVLLEDDSYPDDTEFLARLRDVPADIGAVSASVWLPTRPGRRAERERGGLPEVFLGCGAAIRRSLFLKLGGYDASLGCCGQEYDFCARLLLAGLRVAFDPLFSITHANGTIRRDMSHRLARLVRNDGWIARRYAPDDVRLAELRQVRERYRRVAAKEHALAGFDRGMAQLRRTLRSQRRTPMSLELWDRFTGLAAARESLQAAYSARSFGTACVVDEGKNAWVIGQALHELGVKVTGENDDAEVMVIGTMSPGPMLDAFERRLEGRRIGGPRILMPWTLPNNPADQLARAAA
jgi:GT2 family glycosyltransferase